MKELSNPHSCALRILNGNVCRGARRVNVVNLLSKVGHQLLDRTRLVLGRLSGLENLWEALNDLIQPAGHEVRGTVAVPVCGQKDSVLGGEICVVGPAGCQRLISFCKRIVSHSV